jgi:TRAP-type transport system periplasmic protein
MKVVYRLVAVMLSLGLAQGAARAQDKIYVMKLGTATINDSQYEWCKRFAAMVEKDSGGRIKGEVYPSSQLGSIPREIEGVQFGSIQGWLGPPEFLVGVDERYEVLSAPGLLDDLAHQSRVVTDPELVKLMLALGADKGIHGVALMLAQPSSVITRSPVRHLADFRGRKLRVLAADMQQDMVKRLGATPVAMTLGDVLPALQQGAIDGAVGAMTIWTTMNYWDSVKYITETGQPYIFVISILSKKWFDALPADLQAIVDADAAKAAAEVNVWQLDAYAKARQSWVEHGGELIALPADEQAEMMQSLATVGAEVVKRRPKLDPAFTAFVAAAQRTK